MARRKRTVRLGFFNLGNKFLNRVEDVGRNAHRAISLRLLNFQPSGKEAPGRLVKIKNAQLPIENGHPDRGVFGKNIQSLARQVTFLDSGDTLDGRCDVWLPGFEKGKILRPEIALLRVAKNNVSR